MEEQIVMKVCDADCQQVVLDGGLAIEEIFLLCKFQLLGRSAGLEESVADRLVGFRQLEGEESVAVCPEDRCRSFH